MLEVPAHSISLINRYEFVLYTDDKLGVNIYRKIEEGDVFLVGVGYLNGHPSPEYQSSKITHFTVATIRSVLFMTLKNIQHALQAHRSCIILSEEALNRYLNELNYDDFEDYVKELNILIGD